MQKEKMKAHGGSQKNAEGEKIEKMESIHTQSKSQSRKFTYNQQSFVIVTHFPHFPAPPFTILALFALIIRLCNFLSL